MIPKPNQIVEIVNRNRKDMTYLRYEQLKWIGRKGGLSYHFLNIHSDKAVICVI